MKIRERVKEKRAEEEVADDEEEEEEEAPSPPPPEKVLYDNRIKRKNVLALNEKVAAIREYEKMPVYKRIGRMFHCSPDQIKRIVQQKDSILKAWEQRTRRCQDAKTLEMKVVRVSMLGKAVYDWIRRMMYYKDLMITDGLIQKMALQFKSAMGLQNFFPHQDWCEKFRQTYNITTNDSKLLKIGYVQGHSVQIKDVIKDVLSECTPDGPDGHSDGDDQQKDENENERQTADNQVIGNNSKSKPSTTTTAANQVSRTLPRLVALPIQGNRIGMTQKVLVATPIGGQKPGAPPMTMTIIPLTTIAQPPQLANAQPSGERYTLPPPMVEIKQEIKREPEDTSIQIKQEYISEDEDLQESPEPQTAAHKQVIAPVMTALPKDNVIDNMDYDNLALSSLRKLIQTQTTTSGSSKVTDSATTAKLPVHTSVSVSPTPPPATTNITPSLPPLTRAPNSVVNRTANKRKHQSDTPALPAIKTCAEARKYLKLLEDFALVRENFRLIGLITRADEVMRELDGDDDVDVD